MDSDSEEEKPPAQTARGKKDKRGSAFMDSDSESDGDAKPGALRIETEANGTAKVPAKRGTVFLLDLNLQQWRSSISHTARKGESSLVLGSWHAKIRVSGYGNLDSTPLDRLSP